MIIKIVPAALILLAAMLAQPALSRELAVAEEELIAVELASVGVEPMTGTPVVLLREPGHGGIVPIFIGPAEARAILMAQRGIATPRPMTHDLASSIIDSLGASLERVIVDELRDSTYHGVLELRIGDSDSLVRVDTRPSDALALAVRNGAAILVAPAVLEAGENIPYSGLDDDEDVVTALGITVMAVTDDLREALGLPDETGVVVTATRSMAALSGLRAGALITHVNDMPVTTPMEFLERIGKASESDRATINYWHAGEKQELELSTEVPEAGPQSRRRL